MYCAFSHLSVDLYVLHMCGRRYIGHYMTNVVCWFVCFTYVWS